MLFTESLTWTLENETLVIAHQNNNPKLVYCFANAGRLIDQMKTIYTVLVFHM